ncbi:CPBP family intramembrane glutamic endopeptidase [Bacteroides oleiciplenus]|uniref:CPBP family intramembrane glutamic endopeptidase n=1 Tax=Bacteroides oleiciplenus TaxID=626931 RepID=UPI0026DD269B|nr:CPBP family intramembrane glutamic endopeptidase [Bacteroides oleiciplenus]
MSSYLRKHWSRHFQYNWKLGVFLILLFGIPRFIIVLESYVTRSYSIVMLVFLCMWFAPFILLTKYGRKGIGIKRPSQWWQPIVSFIIGGLSCFIIFGLFLFLFDKSIENAFVYIGGNNPGSSITGDEKSLYFWIAVIPSMIFSPIGEEFLYRGIIHGSFVPKFGEMKASVFDSLAFALTHIAHFGIIYTLGTWQFLPIPAALWVASMFLVSQVFFRCKLFCSSIWGAVAAHSGFNFVMMYGIFYLL